MSKLSRDKVVTVLGEVPPDKLGVTLTHEHLFHSLRQREIFLKILFTPDYKNPRPWLWDAPIDITKVDMIRRDPFCNMDNLSVLNPELVTKEVLYFKMAGGGTICDVTPGGGDNPFGLKMVSSASGVNVIAGCGYYLQPFHPPNVAKSNVEELAEGMIRDLTEEMVKGTGIRAGIIGELGISSKMHPDEKKVLHAAATAHKETGAPIMLHQGPPSGLEAISILLQDGVKPDRIIAGHCDATGPDLDYIREIADRGVYVEFDTWGFEIYLPQLHFSWPNDRDRIICLAELIKLGYVKQILVSHDYGSKVQLRSYGGWGYSYFLEYVVPRMLSDERIGRSGKIRTAINKGDIQTILMENPKRVLPWH